MGPAAALQPGRSSETESTGLNPVPVPSAATPSSGSPGKGGTTPSVGQRRRQQPALPALRPPPYLRCCPAPAASSGGGGDRIPTGGGSLCLAPPDRPGPRGDGREGGRGGEGEGERREGGSFFFFLQQDKARAHSSSSPPPGWGPTGGNHLEPNRKSQVTERCRGDISQLNKGLFIES